MTATSSKSTHSNSPTSTVRTPKERPSEARGHAPLHRQMQPSQQPQSHDDTPAAGAHAARHLINEDATPGAGVLPSHAHRFGKEVDGGAG